MRSPNLSHPESVAAAVTRAACSALVFVCVLGSGGRLAAQQPQAAKPAPAKKDVPAARYWNSRWEFEDIDVGRLSERLNSIGIDIGLNLRGKVSVRFNVGIPLTALRDGAAYRFDGTLTSPRLFVDRVEFRNLATTVQYRDGLATLTQLKSSVVDDAGDSTGRLAGRGTLQLVPQGDATAALDVERLSVAPISELIATRFPSAKHLLPSAGRFTGDVQFTAPIKSISKIETYELQGQFRGTGLKLGSLPAANIEIGKAVLEQGRLQISGVDLQAGSSDQGPSEIRLIGKADVPLDGGGRFSFEVAGDDLPLGKIADLFSDPNTTSQFDLVSGKIDFRVNGSGELAGDVAQSVWTISGSVASPSLQLAGVDLGAIEHDIRFSPTALDLVPRRDEPSLPASVKLRSVRSRYAITDKAYLLSSLTAKLFGGQLTGTVTIPRTAGDDLVAKIEFNDLRPAVQLPVSANISTAVAVTLTGDADWRVPLDKLAAPIAHQGAATLSASGIMIGDEPVGDLTTQISADAGELTLAAAGEVFGGTIKIETAATALAGDTWRDVSSRIRSSLLEIDGLSLATVGDLLAGRKVGLSGRANAKLSFDHRSRRSETAVIPDAIISMELSRVKHRGRLLSRTLRLDGKVENDVFQIQSLVGDYANGSVRLNGRVYLLDDKNAFHPRVDARLVASRVKLDQGLWFLGDSAEQLRGRISVKGTIGGYRESIRLRGSVSGRELAIHNLPVGTAHSGLVASLDHQTSRWTLSFPSIHSSVGGGQLEGQLHLASGRHSGVDLTSRWKTRRVDFFRLTNQIGRFNSLAHGEISGEISLRGKSVRSVDDLAGRFDLQLGETRGASIPGLIGASRFLGPVSLASQSFDVGQAVGIIGKGAIVIDEFWLGSGAALVRADGKIYLRSGRMDLNALIATGDYRDVAANFAQLAQQYAFRSLLPASAIISVSQLLRDRTLVVSVLGTTRNPIVRLRPIETFREEAARFLLREGQRLVLVGITTGTIDSLDGGF